MNNGKIVQVMGPVVDVEFENKESLPKIKDALTVENGGKRSVMEVAQHVGNNTVRCIMLAASEGLCRDMEVTATGQESRCPWERRPWDGCSMCWEIPWTAGRAWKMRSTG